MVVPARRTRFALVLGLCFVAPTASQGKPPAPSPREAKVDSYVDLVNAESNHVLQDFDSYLREVGEATPSCSGVAQHVLGDLGPSALERIAGYRKGLARPPTLPGDAPAGEMVEALATLEPALKEGSRYYFLSQYREDGCARGRALHPVLLEGFRRFARADRALRAYLDQVTDERDAAELGRLERQYGRGLHYFHRKLMVDGKPLVRMAKARPPDPAALRDRLAAFRATVDGTVEAVKATRTPRNSDAMYQGGYDQLVDAARQLVGRAGDYLALLDRQAKEAEESARVEPGAAPREQQKARERAAGLARAAAEDRDHAVENLVITYNYLVNRSNQVMYSKSMK